MLVAVDDQGNQRVISENSRVDPKVWDGLNLQTALDNLSKLDRSAQWAASTMVFCLACQSFPIDPTWTPGLEAALAFNKAAPLTPPGDRFGEANIAGDVLLATPKSA